MEMQSADVSCGTRLAPSCAACSTGNLGDAADGCFGDCTFGDGACVPITAAAVTEPAFTVPARSWLFNPAMHTASILDAGSPLTSSALALLLVNASPAVNGAGSCVRDHNSGSGQLLPCVPAARLDLATTLGLINSARDSPRPCRCPGGHSSGSWLHSRLSGAIDANVGGIAPPGGNAAAESAIYPLALLREPLENLASELLPHPGLCEGPTWPASFSNGSTSAAAKPECSRQALDSLATAPLQRRFARLLKCCANPLSRSLVGTLPASAATARCASGDCDGPTLYALARRALLLLPWFGTLQAIEPSLLLLHRTLGVRSQDLRATTREALSSPQWPHPPTGSTSKSNRDDASAAASIGAASLTAAQARAWQRASAIDFEIYELAMGVLAFRLRRTNLPPLLASPRLASPLASRVGTQAEGGGESATHLDRRQVEVSRVFETPKGGGRRMVAVPAPLVWSRRTDTLVFVHIAKCGGTSFNRRLMSLDVDQQCECGQVVPNRRAKYHNGHRIVEPRSCECLRYPRHTFMPQWSKLAKTRLTPKRRRPWNFLQRQWLVSPETTGWLGGVHAPVRLLQAYLILSARLTTSVPLARGIHYVALLREPTRRFLSEFYETYDGWEAKLGTPPRLPRASFCSARLPTKLRRRAVRGIDNCSKEEYDELFTYWLQCPTNMAASRQTRALAYAALATGKKDSNTTDLELRNAICRGLPIGAFDPGCSLRLARHALYQFTFIGLNSERCASEKLLEAQFGLSFGAPPLTTTAASASAATSASPDGPSGKGEGGDSISGRGTESGKGAHRVAKLRFDALSPATQQLVRSRNRDDLELYAEAEKLFHRRLDAYGIARDVKCAKASERGQG